MHLIARSLRATSPTARPAVRDGAVRRQPSRSSSTRWAIAKARLAAGTPA